MDTKTIKMMTKSFNEPWNQVDQVTKFAQRLDDQQVYLNGHDGINITEANKLQFYIEHMLDSGFFDTHILMRWEKRDPTRKTWDCAKTYFEKCTKREEVYDLSIGGTAKKARFESSLNAQERRGPPPEQRDDDDTISPDDSLQEYLDNILSASTAKEERSQHMADDARRKDDQLAAMLSRMDAKDKQMTDLIAQVTNMSTQRKLKDDDNDDKSQRTRNPKRKAKDGGAGGRNGSGIFRRRRRLRVCAGCSCL